MRIFSSLKQLRSAKVLVCGDFMLDAYTSGIVKRISPEAPVPVLKVMKEESRPGGAGNVALNLVSLGMEVFVAGRVGDDYSGKMLIDAFAKEKVDASALLLQKGYVTPLKRRLIADSQQLMRVDSEVVSPMPEEFESMLVETIAKLLPGIDVVAISDYAKGGITTSFCEKILELARKNGVPTVVDPKGSDFAKYSGATIIKPNKQEAYAAAKISEEVPIENVAQILLNETKAHQIIITRSEEGITLFSQDGSVIHSETSAKEIVDVTGAGDTVLACITTAVANQVPMDDALQLSNCAASIAIEHLGCYRVTLPEISKRLLQNDSGNKIFSELQISALEQVLQKQDYVLVVLDDVDKLTLEVFSELQSYCSVHPEHVIVVYIAADPVRGDIVSLLSSFSEVDFIIEQPECMRRVIDLVPPKAMLALEKHGLQDKSPSYKALSELFEHVPHYS